MKHQNFKQHLKPQPRLKTDAQKLFERQQGFKFDVRGFDYIECRPISKTPGSSPVSGEKMPQFDINLHARERKGQPFISGSMHATMKDFSLVLTLLIVSYCREQNIDIASFFRGMEKFVQSVNGEVKVLNEKEVAQ